MKLKCSIALVFHFALRTELAQSLNGQSEFTSVSIIIAKRMIIEGPDCNDAFSFHVLEINKNSTCLGEEIQ